MNYQVNGELRQVDGQADEEILAFTVSDEELEAAAAQMEAGTTYFTSSASYLCCGACIS